MSSNDSCMDNCHLQKNSAGTTSDRSDRSDWSQWCEWLTDEARVYEKYPRTIILEHLHKKMVQKGPFAARKDSTMMLPFAVEHNDYNSIKWLLNDHYAAVTDEAMRIAKNHLRAAKRGKNAVEIVNCTKILNVLKQHQIGLFESFQDSANDLLHQVASAAARSSTTSFDNLLRLKRTLKMNKVHVHPSYIDHE